MPRQHVFRNVSISNRHLERALGKVEDAIEAHLVLWTAAEQLAITQAFEKVSFMLSLSSCFCFFSCEMATYYPNWSFTNLQQFGMNRRELRNAVPQKSSDEAWDYTLRYLLLCCFVRDTSCLHARRVF